MKMFGFGSVNTPISYISYMEDSYLFFSIPKFDYSLKKQTIGKKKIYTIDNGLLISNSTSFSSDRGRMLENLVFVALRRKYKNIYYFNEKGECDFLVKQNATVNMAIQVCYELTDDNKDREIKGLLAALDAFNLNSGLILTYNQEDKMDVNRKNIKIMPVWKWL